jgi:TPR repeat protein
MNTFPSTVDWLAQRAGLPAKKRTDAAIWAACRRWDYAQTNDVEIQEKDRQTARLAEAEELSLEAPDRAFRIWLHLAERGSVWAMLMVAWCYLDGYGVAEDRARAMSFYRQATTGGSTQAFCAVRAD